MKHLIAIVAISFLAYFAWGQATTREKTAFLQAVRRHILPLVVIAVAVCIGVTISANFQSLRFL